MNTEEKKTTEELTIKQRKIKTTDLITDTEDSNEGKKKNQKQRVNKHDQQQLSVPKLIKNEKNFPIQL